MEEGEEGARGAEDTRRIMPTESYKQGSQSLKWKSWRCGSVLGPLNTVYGCELGSFVGLLTVKVRVSLAFSQFWLLLPKGL